MILNENNNKYIYFKTFVKVSIYVVNFLANNNIFRARKGNYVLPQARQFY